MNYTTIKVKRKKKKTAVGIKKSYYVPRARKTPQERFAMKYTVNPLNNCWEWTGGINNKQFGMFRYEGKMVLAHRVQWQMTTGIALVPGEIVYHTCANTRCVNPDHLAKGNHKDRGNYYKISGFAAQYAQLKLNKNSKNTANLV